ncbi:MAG: ribonuclease P protein component [bacterium]
MLPPLPPLRRREEFQRVFRQGGRMTLDGLQLRYVRTDGPTRVGIVVRTDAVKRANRRNRIRRLVREALRLLAPEIAPGYDLVVIPAGEPPVDHREAISATLMRLLARAALYHGDPPPSPTITTPNPRYRPPVASPGRRRR